MPDTLITMFASGSGGTEDAAAVIDVPDDGNLVGVQVAHAADIDSTDEASTVSLSFIATNQLTTNDSRGEIIVTRVRSGLVTAEGGSPFTNFYTPMDVGVSGGERLYIHIVASAGVITGVSMILHFSFRRPPARRSQRRR